MTVTMTQDWGGYGKGETIEVSTAVGERMLKLGVAIQEQVDL